MTWSYDHVHLKASNLDETIRFYKENFNAVQKQTMEARGIQIISMDINGMSLYISPSAKGENLKSGSAEPQFGLIHFALRCDNLEKEISVLKKNNVEITMAPVDIGGGTKIAFIKAPDEVIIELLQRG